MVREINEGILIWCLPAAIALHNLEEAIWLPGWTQKTTVRWGKTVRCRSFRFAVSVLTSTAFLAAAWVQVRGFGSMGHYVLASYTLGQGLNIFFPHLVAAVVTRSYAPGLATGVLFVLPSGSAFLVHGLTEGWLRFGRLMAVAGIFIPLMLLSIGLLFRVGRLFNAGGFSARRRKC